ncbi:MAG: hypothetical protein JWL64_1524 [Frankiales bacterium]|nr:hypothetical protein [Frankiales bacterium]
MSTFDVTDRVGIEAELAYRRARVADDFHQHGTRRGPVRRILHWANELLHSA